MVNPNTKVGTAVIAFTFAIPLGLLLSSLYVELKGGFRPEILRDFNYFSFWRETPVYLGYVSDTFLICVTIMTATATVTVMGSLVLLFRPHNFGSARWGTFPEMRHKGYLKPYRRITGPIFGKTSGPRGFGQYLSNGDQPHSLIVAPTRAGKGVGVVIPTLLTFDGSVMALDVKGELFELTSRARLSRGDRVIKFAPLDMQGRTHCYNPVMDIVATPPERRFAETRRLAVNLIAPKGKAAEGFIDGARDLFIAGILACIERGTPTIGSVYDLFTQPGEKYKLFAQLAEESNVPEAIRIFDNMAGNDTKIITSYTSVLGDGGLNLWADPLIKNATSRSDFSIYDLRRDPTTIYLCVSPNDLEVIAPLIRLFFQQTVSILQRTLPKKDEIFEVLFLLDEFKHLGKLEAIETAVTTIAGYRGRFMFIIQSLAALTGAYEQSGKENFLSNTGIQVFMATADDETPQYISKAIGDRTFRQKSTSYSMKEWFSPNMQISDQGSPLLRPEEVRLVDEKTQIVLIKGQPPLRMPKVKYYSDRFLKPIFDAQTGPLPEPEPIDLQQAFLPLTPLTQPSAGHKDTTASIQPNSDLIEIERAPVEDDKLTESNGIGPLQQPISPPEVIEASPADFEELEEEEDVHDEDDEMEWSPDSPISDVVVDQGPPIEDTVELEAQRRLLDTIIGLQKRTFSRN